MENSEQSEMAEKRKAFMETAAKNKANLKLHTDLMRRHLENGGVAKSSIASYLDSGIITGSLMVCLIEYAEKYHEEKTNLETTHGFGALGVLSKSEAELEKIVDKIKYSTHIEGIAFLKNYMQ